MIEYIILVLTIFAFSLASIEDIKKREVYDYLNFFYAISVLSLAIVHSAYIGSFDPIKYSGFGMLLSFLIGSLLYLIGMWGGGDAKFLIGFGASIPYFQSFSTSLVSDSFFNSVVDSTSFLLTQIIEILSIYIVILNVLCMFFILYFITKKREKQIIYNALTIFIILFFLTLGFFIEVDPFILFIWGFLAFAITFFSDDYLLDSLYLKVKKKTKFLKEKDIIDSNVKLNNKKIISQETLKEGIPRNLLEEIKSIKSTSIIVRKILPISILLLLNFILFGVKILSIDKFNLEIFAYLLKFLLVSFFIGGLIAIGMMIFYALRNMKKLKGLLNQTEKAILLVMLVSLPVLFIVFKPLASIPLIGSIYFFLKVSRHLEGQMFIAKKKISDIVPGDWIVEDVIINKKTYYKVEDFKLGIDEVQLEKIQKLSKEVKSFKELYVKDGLAFLPPLFIGFLILLFV